MSLSSLFISVENASRSALKILKLKRLIIKVLLTKGSFTIADLSEEVDFSVPTVTKIINELLAENIVCDFGKIDTSGGRRPNIYGINPQSGFYLGIEVNRRALTMGIQNLKNDFVMIQEDIPFILENTKESLDSLCQQINEFVVHSGVPKEIIVGACVNLSGRINPFEGFSHNYFFFEEKPLNKIIESKIEIKTYLENDSRAMAFGEYNSGVVNNEKNVIFVNISWGVGVGIVTDGRLYYGKSGYSGEFGHSPLYDNNILCQCGKSGCLETEVSGWAFERYFKNAITQGKQSSLAEKFEKADYHLETIVKDILDSEDVLAIDIISQLGDKMGRYLSILINIFNPELVVIGGTLSASGDYLTLPIQSGIKKHSLNLVSHDMELKVSRLGSRAGIVGACYIVREKFLEVLG